MHKHRYNIPPEHCLKGLVILEDKTGRWLWVYVNCLGVHVGSDPRRLQKQVAGGPGNLFTALSRHLSGEWMTIGIRCP